MYRKKSNSLPQTSCSSRFRALPCAASVWPPLLVLLVAALSWSQPSGAISIKPADFERLIMPCYLGANSAQQQLQQQYSYTGNAAPQQPQFGRSPYQNNSLGSSSNLLGSSGYQPQQLPQPAQQQPPAYYSGAGPGASAAERQFQGGGGGGGYGSSLGPANSVPRANTVDNFIALVAKLEQASPRLANNVDQLIRTLLGRFRMDNYYYDVSSRLAINAGDQNDILAALLSGQQAQQPFLGNSDMFPEHLLDFNEKCSMYFMLSHYIEKTSTGSASGGASLGQVPVVQLAGPLNGQRAPGLQAAGSGYPLGQSAQQSYSGAGPRFPGPSPSFGSPAMNNMNAFGSGLNNNLPGDMSAKSAYGVNVPQPSTLNYNPALRPNPYGSYSSGTGGAPNLARPQSPPYIDGAASAGGGARSRRPDDGGRSAFEFGVVTLAGQDNAALVLNRVLLGLLAAATPPQSIRQLAAMLYTTTPYNTNSPKLDEEIDPLFAATLADLWAVSSIPKAGKPPFDVGQLGDDGRWNDTMCPTLFQLERASSIRFTTAELLGGLDGFNLGQLRRRLMSMRRHMRLSELLRMYYSQTGFRPQFAEFGVCNRNSVLNQLQDELHRQAENYLRLHQLKLPTTDNEIATSINRLGAFRDVLNVAANKYTPNEVCQQNGAGGDSSSLYASSALDQCEIARADVVAVLDSSPQANGPFMQLVLVKLAQRLGLSRDGNSVTIVTNQQDTTGYAGAYSFNTIVRNSTNLAEIGCALVHDSTAMFQGGQVSEPTRLMEMFERALVNLDSEYMARLQAGSYSAPPPQGSASASYYSSAYSSQSTSTNRYSSWFGGSSAPELANYMGASARNTGGARVIIWFNYGNQLRPAQASSGPTDWNRPASTASAFYSSSDSQYRFYEAKKYLRENFRDASILAAATNRDDVKAFVYNEDQDIFADIPAGAGGGSSGGGVQADYYPNAADQSGALSGPAEQLAARLLQRMCLVPALFQYPMCFRVPSQNIVSVGYISPTRKQYWMMSPKTFFASTSIRMAFKVEGGRLRVCFGRKPKPDETALRSGLATSSSILFGSAQSGQNPAGSDQLTTPSPSSNDYYTGREFGVCKDVSPGQEIDFLVSDACYRKSIADCEPFYFVIKEISNPGEGDPNYMCRDDGCKRIDQAKFYMTHSGVTCSSAFRSVRANSFLIVICAVVSSGFLFTKREKLFEEEKNAIFSSALALSVGLLGAAIKLADAQHAGVYDFGQGREGEKRGNWTPSQWTGVVLVVMVILAGLAVTIGLCYYATKKARKGMTQVEQNDWA